MPAPFCLALLLAALALGGDFGAKGHITVDNFESIATVPENSPPRTRISEFQIIVDNSTLVQITVTSIPKSEFFQILWRKTHENRTGNHFQAEIFLSNHASLDHERTPMYVLTISIFADKMEPLMEKLRLNVVGVHDVRCGEHFQAPGGDTVNVLETATPLSQIYTVVLAPTYSENFSYAITKSIPISAKDFFSVDWSGSIYVPPSGFGRQHVERHFRLHIVVTENSDTICTGMVTIVVIPVHHWPPVFTRVPRTVSIPENQGPEFYVTKVSAAGEGVHFHLATSHPSFQLGEDTGIIRTTSNLDLDQNPGLAVSLLVITAYDDSYLCSSLANVTVYVTDVNDNSPVCTPPIFVTEIPETTPVGSTLFQLSCSDADYTNTNLLYSIVPSDNSQFKFVYEDHSVKLNESLNYDSAQMATVDFRHTAVITVVDSGVPPLTTTVSLLVIVSQVNEFPPVFHGPKEFTVPENSAGNTRVGVVNATDADWIYNNIQFSIVGHIPPIFYIHPFTGEINTLVPLDFEKVDTYVLTIQAVDMNYDVAFDSSQQRTSYAQYTIYVKNVNDIPPVCSPPFYKETIYSTLAENVPIVTLSCTDRDSEQLIYRIVGGNTNSRFSSRGSSLFSRNDFSYNMDGVIDPTTFELLIQVTDVNDADSKLQLTTTAIVTVHVIPWTSTLPVTRTPVHKVVTLLDKYWKPQPWFVVLLTVVAVLTAGTLALMLYRSRALCFNRIFPQSEVSQHLLLDRFF
ncbi:cadherin-related family member 4-like isoform X2 [Hypanus sabinus]|uniref:cadherin-related family member 4-like isoform X2 n=1 Tax=Hypanus sabinus TaxID=79690 RepID=UPI0028C45E34|nr:cadherin-related family member 4-like isoform X2 [Hypanus sabinus]